MAKSTPYYLYGYERKYPYAWHGGAGGVPWSQRAAETRELSGADMIESGLDSQYRPSPAFNHTRLHDPSLVTLGDWPLVRPSGPEPLDPNGLGALSDNEKKLAGALAIGAIAFFMLRKKKRRR